MFVIRATTPPAFWVTTVVGTGGRGMHDDSQLFLFDAAGMGVYMDDDVAAVSLRSTLQRGINWVPPLLVSISWQ